MVAFNVLQYISSILSEGDWTWFDCSPLFMNFTFYSRSSVDPQTLLDIWQKSMDYCYTEPVNHGNTCSGNICKRIRTIPDQQTNVGARSKQVNTPSPDKIPWRRSLFGAEQWFDSQHLTAGMHAYRDYVWTWIPNVMRPGTFNSQGYVFEICCARNHHHWTRWYTSILP